jgi:hypothetical protein
MRLHWLVLERKQIDVCYKDPGFEVSATISGDISLLVNVYLGHATWREITRRDMLVSGNREVVRNIDKWLQLDRLVGRDLPIVPPARRGTLKRSA